MTERPTGSGADPIGDFQQWLVRSGAREVGRGLRGRIRGALGLSDSKMDVWESATTTPPPGEAPECAWCPVCRAARLLRETGPDVGSQVAAAGEALATVVQDAVAAVDAALAATGRAATQERARAASSADHEGGLTGSAPAGQDGRSKRGEPNGRDGLGKQGEPNGRVGATEQGSVTGKEQPAQESQGGEDEPGAAEALEGLPDEPDDRG